MKLNARSFFLLLCGAAAFEAFGTISHIGFIDESKS